jgi:DNA end-binding protein Ku
MAPRPFWKGYMKLSLVTCPVAMTPATSEDQKVRFHTLNRKTGNRIISQYVDAETGRPVEEDDEVKGYARGEDEYVLLEDDELEAISLESARTIDESFVQAESLDWIWYDTPYYVTPDDPVGEEAYCVIRDAMRSTTTIGVSRLVLHRRERAVILEPRDNGIVLGTLRFGDEVRDPGDYFETIGKKKLDPELMRLIADLHQVAQEALEHRNGRRSGANSVARHHRGKKEGDDQTGENKRGGGAAAKQRRQHHGCVAPKRRGRQEAEGALISGPQFDAPGFTASELVCPSGAPRSAPRRRGNPPMGRRQARRGVSVCSGP